ncbi:MAG: hypothetical protein COA71_00555 [SAR86 cluster bacterium]|uniref:Alginate export domain-containing protein n=1 Tax=SAR86 cluster bacterium TaxID=2030880 RepID=A0A2A5CJ49_9GAMM|nr:hypothetical protein [bacterium AH-315-I11]PCJ43396.1 MAG: hypothetical protein COA71_00555 [SAR86 cluster bacterium]
MLRIFNNYNFLLLTICLSGAVLGQASEENTIPEDGSFGLGWLDQTQALASNSANNFADKVDRFFGLPRSDLEAAYSSLRISVEQLWHENNNSATNFHLRGKIHLPRINERVSLLFSEDEGEGVDFYEQNNIGNSEQQSINANLQFNILDRVRNRLDFRIGLRSSLKAKTSIRYRYELPRGDSVQHRFAQTLYFVDGDGFGSLSRYELDKALTPTSLLRWSSDLRVEENFSGAHWASQLSYSRQVSDQTALLFFTRINAQTNPGFIQNYDLGFRLRKNIGRPWLFAELEPGHAWTKIVEGAKRQSSFFLFFRIEMAIGRT